MQGSGYPDQENLSRVGQLLMAVKQAPCKECPDRPQGKGCGMHGTCEKYLTFREELNAQTRERRADEKRNSMLNDFYVEGVTRSIKRQGRRV